MMNKLSDLVENNLNRIIGKGIKPSLLVAVSGGMDSMCLLDILYHLGHHVSVAHVNYNLRGEDSKLDKELVENYAAEKQLDCYSLNAFLKDILNNSPKNLQAEARRIRYDFFATLVEAKEIDYVLTAHHLNDQLETFLFNISRNAHINELQGIAEKRDNIVRPMLSIPKASIEQYCISNTVPFREDLSNREVKYNRNKFRNKVIAPLQENFPDFIRQFGRTVENIKQENLFLQHALEHWKNKIVKQEEDKSKWDMKILLKAPSPEYLFKLLIHEHGGNEKLANQAFTAYTNKRTGAIFQVGNKTLLLNRDEFILVDALQEENDSSLNLLLDLEQKRVNINSNTFISMDYVDVAGKALDISKSEAYFDVEKIQLPLYLRKISKGDSIKAFGMSGRSKKIKKILTDAKIDRIDKKSVLVLTDATGRIIWVPGFAHSEIAKIDENSQKAYFLKVNRVKNINSLTR